jgi:hypothetical protein
MAEPNFQLAAEDDFDDLPRTLRREKAAREREARERRSGVERGPGPELGSPVDPHYAPSTYVEEPVPAVVKQLDIPFFRLMFFFIKAVLAAVPALILLGAIIWGAGEILQSLFPWLVKMRIVILFPQM